MSSPGSPVLRQVGLPTSPLILPQDQVELSPSGLDFNWKDAAGAALLVGGLMGLTSHPWAGGLALAGSAAFLSPRIAQGYRGVSHLGEKAVAGIQGIVADQIENTRLAYMKEPKEGPERLEYFLRQNLRSGERHFGKDSIYSVGTHIQLAEHFRQSGRALEASDHYQKALAIFEAELQQRGEADSLHRLMPASLTGSAHDAASLYEKAGEFFSLFGGPEKSTPMFERALQLCPENAQLDRRLELRSRLASSYLDGGNTGSAMALLESNWNESCDAHAPTSGALSKPAEDLARLYQQQGKNREAEALWQISVSLEGTSSAVGLNSLAGLYGQVGKSDMARELRRESEIRSLEQSVAHAQVATPPLAKDLRRLVQLYEEKGDHSAKVRTQSRLEVIEARVQALRANH